MLQPELAFGVGLIAQIAAGIVQALLLLVLAQVFLVLLEHTVGCAWFGSVWFREVLNRLGHRQLLAQQKA